MKSAVCIGPWYNTVLCQLVWKPCKRTFYEPRTPPGCKTRGDLPSEVGRTLTVTWGAGRTRHCILAYHMRGVNQGVHTWSTVQDIAYSISMAPGIPHYHIHLTPPGTQTVHDSRYYLKAREFMFQIRFLNLDQNYLILFFVDEDE